MSDDQSAAIDSAAIDSPVTEPVSGIPAVGGNHRRSQEADTKPVRPQSMDSPPAMPERYVTVRRASVELCKPLAIEDYGLQAMAEVSPPKWHLAHTSWFFETFILKPFASTAGETYTPFHPRFEYLFNSYYNGIGEQYLRSRRGLLSRPTVSEVLDYRHHVDAAMLRLLGDTDHASYPEILQRCELGLNHEQQHQELICTDIKYSFSFNPLYPAMNPSMNPSMQPAAGPSMPESGVKATDDDRAGGDEPGYIHFDATETDVGFQGDGFHFDNEGPRHRYILQAYRLADRVISNAEFLAFVEHGGYRQPGLWLADGWAWLKQNDIGRPLYWQADDDGWHEYTLHGRLPLNLQRPLCHINYYEADAFARWMGKRLPTEYEWEHACAVKGVTPEAKPVSLHPDATAPDTVAVDTVDPGARLHDMFGSVWQWTSSGYSSYPGYRPAEGAIGEYNGKFMSSQMVLRGSSCVTPPGHARRTYRNFFYPVDRWQFSGIRLADDG
jgi:ergothioneine biosynthesis protein EgtB